VIPYQEDATGEVAQYLKPELPLNWPGGGPNLTAGDSKVCSAISTFEFASGISDPCLDSRIGTRGNQKHRCIPACRSIFILPNVITESRAWPSAMIMVMLQASFNRSGNSPGRIQASQSCVAHPPLLSGDRRSVGAPMGRYLPSGICC
jgi:hypothetical protein